MVALLLYQPAVAYFEFVSVSLAAATLSVRPRSHYPDSGNGREIASGRVRWSCPSLVVPCTDDFLGSIPDSVRTTWQLLGREAPTVEVVIEAVRGGCARARGIVRFEGW